jgi:hypothetical protein
MSSPSISIFTGEFTGVAADITVSKCPFRPRIIRFNGPGGLWGYKNEDMSGSSYHSSTGADAGVTITDTGFVVANGADVNPAGSAMYYEVTAW